jgi:hypothetical protein
MTNPTILLTLKTGFLLTIIGLVCCFSFAPSQAQSYQENLEASRTNKSLIVAEIRPKIFGDLPSKEMQIYSEIRFDVSSEDKIMNAMAYRRAGIRRITLTEAMGRGLELNADALLIEQRYRMPRFLGRYMEYVCQQYATNQKRYDAALPPARIASPYELAKFTQADWDAFYSDPGINRKRAEIVGGAYAFLLAHEVGHHVLGHVDDPTRDLPKRRAQESAADDWAINLLIKKQVSPVSGIIPLLFFYYTDQNPISKERGSDHPADVRRLLAMYEGLEKRLPELKAYIVASGQDYETIHRQVISAIAAVKQEIGAQ